MKKVELVSTLGYILIALFGILGVYVAYRVYGYYPSVTRGLVGLVAIYYFFKYNLSPKQMEPQPADLTIRFPKGFQYLLSAFLLSLVLAWAGFQAVDMVFWIVSMIKI